RRLGELVRRYADVLQGSYSTEREGRFVLPVRADAHYRVEGIVLGSSGSGSTLFVEPREVTEIVNRLRLREAEVEREVARVLAELTALVHEPLGASRARRAAAPVSRPGAGRARQRSAGACRARPPSPRRCRARPPTPPAPGGARRSRPAGAARSASRCSCTSAVSSASTRATSRSTSASR